MKSFILASALALTPTQSAETHLLGHLNLPVPVEETMVEDSVVVLFLTALLAQRDQLELF